MGLLHTKESTRQEELSILVREAWDQYHALGPAAAAEKATGTPALPGSSQALRAAAAQRAFLLQNEQDAVFRRQGLQASLGVSLTHPACRAAHGLPDPRLPSPAVSPHLPALLLAGAAPTAVALGKGEPNPPPMPKPTPTLQLVPAQLSAPPPCCGSGMEPSTPTEGSSSLPRQPHGSLGTEELGAAGSAEGSEAAPLLAAGAAAGTQAGPSGAGPSGAGLRQRPGQHRGST